LRFSARRQRPLLLVTGAGLDVGAVPDAEAVRDLGAVVAVDGGAVLVNDHRHLDAVGPDRLLKCLRVNPDNARMSMSVGASQGRRVAARLSRMPHGFSNWSKIASAVK
jgi:hypothetical protein